MTDALALTRLPLPAEVLLHHYLSVTVSEQLLGVPVSVVRDVFKPDAITPVPLAAPEIAGLLNLRGRVHTVINMRRRLGIAPAGKQPGLAIGVALRGEAYALLVDAVGDVLALSAATFAPNPPHLAVRWAALSAGVHALDAGLMVVLNVEELVRPRSAPRAGRADLA